MTKKISKKEQYSIQVQDLMDVIPLSTDVSKQLDGERNKKGRVVNKSIRWVVKGYAVYSGTRSVNSIAYDDSEQFEFCLKVKDYKNFVQACEDRRAQLLEQYRKNAQTL